MIPEIIERVEAIAAVDCMLSGGEVLPAQLPSVSTWTAEKKLAAAVFNSGMMSRDMEWIESHDIEWPYSFLRLCDLFDLDADWVREQVHMWQRMEAAPCDGRRFQHAA